MALGPRDTTSLAYVTGWDATEMEKFRLRDGATAGQVAALLDGAVGALNIELYNDPFLTLLIGDYTDQLTVEYRIGSNTQMELHTEYSRPDPQRADVAGHMLPLRSWDYGLGWTWDYLRKARSSHLLADITAGVRAARMRYRTEVLSRLLRRGDDSGSAYGLGTSGLSPGFATAAATTGVDFIPPNYGGTTFTVDHEHYNTITGGALTAAAIADMAADLKEHGHAAPFELIVNPTDALTVAGLTGFVPVAQQLVRYGNTTALAAFDAINYEGVSAIGAISEFRVWTVPGWPQYYAFGWKSYGSNNPLNPLRVRLDMDEARPTVRAFPDPLNGTPTHPLQYAMLFTEFGVGLGPDRTNGVALYTNNATWTDSAVQ